MSDTKASTDYSVRAMTDDGAFRVIVARTTSLVRAICRLQNVEGLTAQTLGELLTGTILFRETMSPGLRVQGILRNDNPKSSLVADSAPEGKTRGLVQAPLGARISAGPGTYLHMMRTLHNGGINQGIVKIEENAANSLSGGGVSLGMMAYMRDSEQVDTMLAVAAVIDAGGNVDEAGGYMVQLLPEVGRGPLAVMAQRLEDFQRIDHLLTPGFTPEFLRDELLYAMPFTPTDRTPLSFDCWCSESRLLGALSTLDRSEIQEMVDAAEPLEIDCDYCHKKYAIQPASLQGLLQAN